MKQRKKQTSSRAWFYVVRGSYLPKSWQAWVLYIPYTAFLLLTAYWAKCHADSAAEALLMIFPQWVSAAVVMTWIAKAKS